VHGPVARRVAQVRDQLDVEAVGLELVVDLLVVRQGVLLVEVQADLDPLVPQLAEHLGVFVEADGVVAHVDRRARLGQLEGGQHALIEALVGREVGRPVERGLAGLGHVLELQDPLLEDEGVLGLGRRSES